MASLTYKEKALLEDFFEMSSGYVLDFSNATFEKFIGRTINIDIYNGEGYEEYCSKANKIRQIWDKESNYTVGILLEGMLSYYEGYCIRENKELTEKETRRIIELKDTLCRLKESGTTLDLPDSPDKDIRVLTNDIHSALSRKKPELVLDRLHTFATNLLRSTCVTHNISIKNNGGKYYPLHSLAGMLKNHYEKDKRFQSSFTLRALQNSISLFESYNDVRNEESFAHDNKILDTIEAQFAVEIMTSVINFIDEIEIYQKKEEEINRGVFMDIDPPF